MSDIFTLIAAEEGGGGGNTQDVSRVYQPHPVYSCTPGNVVGLYGSEYIGDLAADTVYGIDGFQTKSAGTSGLVNSSTDVMTLALPNGNVLMILANSGTPVIRASILTPTTTSSGMGTEVVVWSSTFYLPTVTRPENNYLRLLDSTHALLVFANGTQARAVVLTISGTTITVGTVYALGTNVGNNFDLCLMAAGKFALAYIDNSTNYPHVIAFSVSGSTVTVGTDLTVTATVCTGDISIDQLTTDKAIVVYQLSTQTLNITSNVITTAGNVPSAGATFTPSAGSFGSASGTFIRMNAIAIGATKALIILCNSATQYQIISTSLSISGTTISTVTNMQTATFLSNYNTNYTLVSRPFHYVGSDGYHYIAVGFTPASTSYNYDIAAWRVDPNTGTYTRGDAQFGANLTTSLSQNAHNITFDVATNQFVIFVVPVSGGTVLWGAVIGFNAAGTGFIANMGFRSIAGQETATSYTPRSVVIGNIVYIINYVFTTGAVTTKAFRTDLMCQEYYVNTSTPSVIGYYHPTDGRVYMRGLISGLTGIKPGQAYYYLTGGAGVTGGQLTFDPASHPRLGLGLSSSEILMKDYIYV